MKKIVFSATDVADTIENMILEGGHIPIYVSGSSMNPFLEDGRDIVWLTAATSHDIAKGRILLFKRLDGSLVLHRIQKILPDGKLVMNGDAQTWNETIDINQVIAVVNEIECNGKKVSWDSFKIQVQSSVWQMLLPVRPLLMRVWRKLRRFKNKH